MKKSIALGVLLLVAFTAMPAFADDGPGSTEVKNLKVGTRNVGAGWVEVLDSTHTEAAKGKTAGEQITGVVAGGAIGARKTLHRAGAGAIDLLTFWIPKKQPLITPEKARLE